MTEKHDVGLELELRKPTTPKDFSGGIGFACECVVCDSNELYDISLNEKNIYNSVMIYICGGYLIIDIDMKG